jgi:osmotically-inducible protein OsmY
VLLRTLVIDPEAVTVTVRDGVVRLDGEVEARSLARIVDRLAASVEGVVGVDDRLRWRLDDTGIRVDMPPLADSLAADERE